MLTGRRQAREAALQIVYLADACRLTPQDLQESVWSPEPLSPKARDFARHLAEGTLAEIAEIDKLLVEYAENWELRRMAAIDRSLLRLAAYELLHDRETPVSVVINEAVEIAKKYSTADSSKFVNGILDKVKEKRK